MTFKYRGDNWADGWECEVETGAQLDIDNGGVDEIDLKVKLTWWVQYRKYEGQERQVEILAISIHGHPIMDKLSDADLQRVEGYCRQVTDYQFEQLGVSEPSKPKRLPPDVYPG
jgi:hypothetical protein